MPIKSKKKKMNKEHYLHLTLYTLIFSVFLGLSVWMYGASLNLEEDSVAPSPAEMQAKAMKSVRSYNSEDKDAERRAMDSVKSY